jgi:flagellar biosynthesis protein FlhF
MKPRKFFAPNSREVLKLVREALGPDALIVSNAKVAGGVEVVALPATVIGDLVAGAGRAETAAPAAPSAGSSAASREAAVARTVSAAVAAETRRRELAAAPAKPAMPAAPAEPLAPAETAAAAGTPSREALSDALMQNMMAELRNMRAVLEQRLSGLAWTELSRRDPSKVSALQTLLTAGFSGELARRLTDPMPDGMDDAEGMKWLVSEVNRNLVTAGADNDIVERGGVYAIVGPTGVGKTTTTAKLAARGVVRHGADRVALLTTDTYRIGAHEQLRIYGRILGVTTSIVRDAAELKTTLSELRGKHMVLIDTVGMSQRDKLVAEQVHALTRSGGNVKRLLLLNATCNGETLEDVVRCYDQASLDGCILTKIDEAQSIGAAIDVIIRNRLALHFVANGQRVPEDLHAPNRQYLIHRALRASPGGAAFGLEHEEYPLVLAPARQGEHAEAAGAFATRMGGYVA